MTQTDIPEAVESKVQIPPARAANSTIPRMITGADADIVGGGGGQTAKSMQTTATTVVLEDTTTKLSPKNLDADSLTVSPHSDPVTLRSIRNTTAGSSGGDKWGENSPHSNSSVFAPPSLADGIATTVLSVASAASTSTVLLEGTAEKRRLEVTTTQDTVINTARSGGTDASVDETQSELVGIAVTTANASSNMDTISDWSALEKNVADTSAPSNLRREETESDDSVTHGEDRPTNGTTVGSNISGAQSSIQEDTEDLEHTVPMDISSEPGEVTTWEDVTIAPTDDITSASEDDAAENVTSASDDVTFASEDVTTASSNDISSAFEDTTSASEDVTTLPRVPLSISTTDSADADPPLGKVSTTERSQDVITGANVDSTEASTQQADTAVKTTNSLEAEVTSERLLGATNEELTTGARFVELQPGEAEGGITSAGSLVPTTPRLSPTTPRQSTTVSPIVPIVTPGSPPSTPNVVITPGWSTKIHSQFHSSPVVTTPKVVNPRPTPGVPHMQSTLSNIITDTLPKSTPLVPQPEATTPKQIDTDSPLRTPVNTPPYVPIKTTFNSPVISSLPVTPSQSSVHPEQNTTPVILPISTNLPVKTTLPFRHTPSMTTRAAPPSTRPRTPSREVTQIPTTPRSMLPTTMLATTSTLFTSSTSLPQAQASEGIPLWIILTSALVGVAALAIICLCVFLCIVCRKRKRGASDPDKAGRDLWASSSKNYVSAMNEYTYVDMGTLSSQNAQQVIPGPDALKMETAFDGDFTYDVIEDDTDQKWKNLWLSESKEQMDTTGLSANTDLDEEIYAQGISTFRSPSKHATPSKVVDNKMIDYPESGGRSDPSTHEYAVPVITPKQSASSSFDSLHVPEQMAEAAELNFPAIVPPSSIKPLLKSNKPQRSPAKRSSKQLSAERKRQHVNSGDDMDPSEYMPVTVIYNENTTDQLI